MTRLVLSLLGPLHVALAGEPISAFRSDKDRALLAFLALESDRPHRREALIGLLWPELPQTLAFNNLRKTLHHLRQTLRDQWAVPPSLLITPKTIQFNPDSDYRLDVAEFAALLEACRQHRHRHVETCAACSQRLRQAAEIYRGDLLQGFFLADCVAFDEWSLVKREWLRRQALETFSTLAAFDARRAEYALAQRYAMRQLALEPWRETAHRQLMQALAARGERGAALAQYVACRRVLAEELGVEPERETTELYEQIVAGNRSAQPVASNLKPLAMPFIGREAELAQLCQQLLDPAQRLVTLVGEGGIGKTWLAIKAAEQVLADFMDGAWFVGLAGLPGDGAEIPEAIAAAMGLTFHGQHGPTTQLLNYLRTRECLLVLDNFEQVLAGVDLVMEIIEGAPKVVVLATSREPLKFQAERVMRVEGLPVPPAQQAEVAGGYSSVQLFVDRAERAAGEFALTAENVQPVIEICRMLEGLPLGIVLAATQIYARSPQAVALAIGQNVDALAVSMRDLPPRQRSIRAVFEWSWQLLTPRQQSSLAQLAVFRGGCGAEAAQAVAGASAAELAALADKSLLRASGPARYEMHELLRQLAAEKLDALGARPAMQEQHAAFYLDLVSRREQALYGSTPQKPVAELRLDLDNIRAAWQWAVQEARIELLTHGANGLAAFYTIANLFQEGERAFDLALMSLQGRVEDAGPLARQSDLQALLGRLKSNQAGLLYWLSQFDQAIRTAQEAIPLAQAAGDIASLAEAYRNWGISLFRQEQIDAAQAPLSRALELARASRLIRIEAFSLLGIGLLAHAQHDLSTALVYHEQALAICRASGDSYAETVVLLDIGNIAISKWDYVAALGYYKRVLAICQSLGDRVYQGLVYNNLGFVAYHLGDIGRARNYCQLALRISRELGDRYNEVLVLQNLSQMSHQLGDHAIAQALAEQSARLAEQNGSTGWHGLALHHLANAQLALGRQDEAVESYQRGLELMRVSGWNDDAMQALAGLARAALARSDSAQALELIEPILLYLTTSSLGGIDEPFRVYLTCYQVLQACGDARALDILQTAHQLLQARAALIGDQRLRRSFLENVPVHRELLGECRQHGVKSSAGMV
jgi:predicted ATPase/DNA-binding SARP family transcriptional activator/Tfp pilus assembly protein PilF